jgi:hypothetical protein
MSRIQSVIGEIEAVLNKISEADITETAKILV